jgi:hypothetical protein
MLPAARRDALEIEDRDPSTQPNAPTISQMQDFTVKQSCSKRSDGFVLRGPPWSTPRLIDAEWDRQHRMLGLASSPSIAA